MVIPSLLPRPFGMELRPGSLPLDERTRIAACAEALPAARRLADMIADEFGFEPAVAEGADAGSGGIHLALGKDAPGGPESYVLDAGPDGVRIEAPSPAGLLWGAMTLRQMIVRRGSRLGIAGARVADRPRYRWRGFMIDSGRAPNSLAQLKRIVRICSAFKLNFLVFREGDDELNAVRYRKLPLGAENPLALSMEEVAEFVDYAGRHGIAVVPEIESLGHSTAKGLHYPEIVSGGFEEPYGKLGVHIRKSHLAPADPRSIDLLGRIYAEWLPLLRSPLIHLGLDEVRLPAEEQARHLAALLPVVDRAAAECGKPIEPIVWADAPPTPESHRGRVIRCLWSYGEEATVGLDNPHLCNQGIGRLSEPGCAERVFMAGGSGSFHTPYAKVDYERAFRNLGEWARWGDGRPNFEGLLAVQWSGNMLDAWLPDFLAAADFGWNPAASGTPFPEEMASIRRHLARIPDAASPRPEEADPPAWDGIWLKDGRWDREISNWER